MLKKVNLFTDGAARGNPGPGAIGIMIYDKDNNLMEEFNARIGNVTNNQAEYLALIKGLSLSRKYTKGKVKCYLDSELVVRQMNREYQVNDLQLEYLFREAKERAQAFAKVTYNHLRRTHSKIQEVDRLSKEAYE